MKISFLGTKGYIDPSSKAHKMHTSTMFSYKNTKVLIDYGENWLFKKRDKNLLEVDFIVITHAHPDHVNGLKKEILCPIYATRSCWKQLDLILKDFPKEKKKIMPLNKDLKLGSLSLKAFKVLHSIDYPAVGYKIQGGRKKIFYVPDVVWIKNLKKAFEGINLYIGDGATIFRNMIRKSKKNKEIFGHVNIRQQLTWCKKNKVPEMVITHCGSDIVKNEKKAKEIIEKLADQRGVKATIAHDKMEIIL